MQRRFRQLPLHERRRREMTRDGATAGEQRHGGIRMGHPDGEGIEPVVLTIPELFRSRHLQR